MPALPQRLVRTLSVALFAVLAVLPALAQDPPVNVSEVGRFDEANNYADVWGDGNFAYLARFFSNRIDIVDIANPAAPILAASYNTGVGGASAQDVKVADGLMFVALEGSNPGSQIVDVRDPYNPVQLTNITTRSAIHNLFYDAGWLYLVDSSTSQIDLLDLRNYDPDAAPGTISGFTYRLTGVGSQFVHDITVVDGRLYASAWSDLVVFDVSDLDSGPPVELGSASGNSVHAAWPTDDGRYVVTGEERGGGGLTLFEIIDNGGSITLDRLDTYALPGDKTSSVHNPLIVGDTIYVSWYEAGIAVLQIDRTAGEMVPIASFDTSPLDGTDSFFGGCWGVYPFLGPGMVLASDQREGLFILDVDPNLLFFDYPQGRPDTVPPDVGTPLEVAITGLGAEVDPGAVTLESRVDGVDQPPVDMAPQGGDLFVGDLPAAACGSLIEYSVAATSLEGDEFTDPADGSRYNTDVVAAVVTTFFDGFDSDLGWAVENIDLQDGGWERGDPNGTGAQPESCFSGDVGSTDCYFTGQGAPGGGDGADDVDGGPTILTSPSMDLTGGEAVLRYAWWFSNDDGDDSLVVELSADGGPWVEARRFTGGSGGWEEDSIRVADFVTPSADVRMRFSVADNPNDSITEAAVDYVRAEVQVCEAPPPIDLTVSDVVPGQTTTLTVTNAFAGETVYFALSGTGTGAGPCLPALGGLCLDLLNPKLAGTAVADGDGTAVLSLAVPDNVPVDTAWFQSAIQRGPGGADSVKTAVVEKPVL